MSLINKLELLKDKDPITQWSVFGPLLEKYRLSVLDLNENHEDPDWRAEYTPGSCISKSGSTPCHAIFELLKYLLDCKIIEE